MLSYPGCPVDLDEEWEDLGIVLFLLNQKESYTAVLHCRITIWNVVFFDIFSVSALLFPSNIYVVVPKWHVSWNMRLTVPICTVRWPCLVWQQWYNVDISLSKISYQWFGSMINWLDCVLSLQNISLHVKRALQKLLCSTLHEYNFARVLQFSATLCFCISVVNTVNVYYKVHYVSYIQYTNLWCNINLTSSQTPLENTPTYCSDVWWKKLIKMFFKWSFNNF